MNLVRKSPALSVALAVFFGPLGLLYSSPAAGAVFTGLFVFLLNDLSLYRVTGMIFPAALWLASIGASYWSACTHNESIEQLKDWLTRD